MALPFYFHPDADAELVDAASYYGERSLTVGIEFLEVVNAAIASITEMPQRNSGLANRDAQPTRLRVCPRTRAPLKTADERVAPMIAVAAR